MKCNNLDPNEFWKNSKYNVIISLIIVPLSV